MKVRIALLMFALSAPAAARDNGQWGNSPTQIRQWFQSLMQPDHPRLSCCGANKSISADATTSLRIITMLGTYGTSDVSTAAWAAGWRSMASSAGLPLSVA